MPSKTGAPKLAPLKPVEYLHSITDTELWEIVNDTDYSEHYRHLAEEEQRLRNLLR